jgi:hypothetical protein
MLGSMVIELLPMTNGDWQHHLMRSGAVFGGHPQLCTNKRSVRGLFVQD